MAEKIRVFISHRFQEQPLAIHVKQQLETQNFLATVIRLEEGQYLSDTELEAFLHDHVQADDWLLLIDSAVARQSQWIPKEITFARRYGKKILRLYAEDCEGKDVGQLLALAEELSNRIVFFMSYSRRDQERAFWLADLLQQHGYQNWLDVQNITALSIWGDEIRNSLWEHHLNGFVLALLSQNSVQSEFVMQEINDSLSRGTPVIPCLIEPKPFQIPEMLVRYQYLDFTHDQERAFQMLINAAENYFPKA